MAQLLRFIQRSSPAGARPHVRELALVALAAEHGVEEAHGERPAVREADEGEACAEFGYSVAHHSGRHRYGLTTHMAVHHLHGAAGDNVTVGDQVQGLVGAVVKVMVEARHHTLLWLSEEADEVALMVKPVIAVIGADGEVPAAEVPHPAALLEVAAEELGDEHAAAFIVRAVDDLVVIEARATPCHQCIDKGSASFRNMQPGQALDVKLGSPNLRLGHGMLNNAWMPPRTYVSNIGALRSLKVLMLLRSLLPDIFPHVQLIKIIVIMMCLLSPCLDGMVVLCPFQHVNLKQ